MLKKIKSRVSHFLLNSGGSTDLNALIQLQPLINQYLPWSTSAMRPSAVVKIVNEVIINNRTHVVEFGSGVSTLFVASTLRAIGSKSKLISIEHDPAWIKTLQRMIKSEKLDEFICVVHAPLKVSKYSIGELRWYCEKSIFDNVENCRFDMAVIDGPLAYTKDLELSRYPALPFLVENCFFQDDHMVVLDDGHRAGEKKIIKIWENKYGYRFKHNFNQGIATSSVRKSFTS